MTRFADLHLYILLKEDKQQTALVAKSFELGYSLVGIPLPSNASANLVEHVRKICGEAGLDFVTRVDLAPRTSRELLEDLRRLRRRFEIISVFCESKPIARQAAKDRRVDLLSFSTTRPQNRFFDNAEAELASESLASLEIDMTPFLSLEGSIRARLFSNLRKEVAAARSHHVPVIISSGAVHEHQLRRPQDYAALTKLFDMDSSLALKAISDAPFTIAERNMLKLSRDFIAPGLRVIRRGKDLG